MQSNFGCHLIRTQRTSRRIRWYEDFHHAQTSFNKRSKRAASTRANTLSPIRIEGGQAQLPRQYTGSREKRPSAVVPPNSIPRRDLTCSSSSLDPIAWQASARQRWIVVCPRGSL